MSRSFITVNGSRLLDRLKTLAQFGALPGGGVCRLALSPEDGLARDFVVAEMKRLGLDVRVDRIGNITGLRPGLKAGPPVMTGSHIDTVRTGGIYDGNLGVMAGLEVVEVLNENHIQTEWPLAVAVFTNEEGARFVPDMLGSCVYVGALSLESALKTVSIDGVSVEEALAEIGYAGSDSCGDHKVRSYVELHIEQGPVLEAEGFTVGCVTGVQGISWQEVTIEGISNHAGTTPMSMRKDAGFAAFSISTQLRRCVDEIGPPLVVTVGSLQLKPNLVNVIPNKAVFTIDVRHTDEQRLQQAERLVQTIIEEACRKEGVTFKQRRLARFEPVVFDQEMVGLVEKTATALGYPHRRLPSGAGHDAGLLAQMCPAAMIFTPSAKGISHNVKEFTEPKDLEAGANVLLHALLQLAGMPN